MGRGGGERWLEQGIAATYKYVAKTICLKISRTKRWKI